MCTKNLAAGSPEPPECAPASHPAASDATGRTGRGQCHLLCCAGATPALIESAAMASSSRALSHEAASAQLRTFLQRSASSCNSAAGERLGDWHASRCICRPGVTQPSACCASCAQCADSPPPGQGQGGAAASRPEHHLNDRAIVAAVVDWERPQAPRQAAHACNCHGMHTASFAKTMQPCRPADYGAVLVCNTRSAHMPAVQAQVSLRPCKSGVDNCDSQSAFKNYCSLSLEAEGETCLCLH